MDNNHIFSEEYQNKKNARLRALGRLGDEKKRCNTAPFKVAALSVVVVMLLTTGLMATGVLPAPKYSLSTDYLPEGVDKIISVEERFEDYNDLTAPPLEYYVVKLGGEDFYKVTDIPEEDLEEYNLEYEVFEANGHYAQILIYNNWTAPEGVEEYTNKQLIVHFEEEDLLIQVWGSNVMTVEDMKKTAEGLRFELTEDDSDAVKVHIPD